jgi:hypothetical protein
VEVVVHQAVRVRPNAEPVEDVGEPLAEFDAIAVVEEDIGMIDTTIHHVVPAVSMSGRSGRAMRDIMTKGCRGDGTTRV